MHWPQSSASARDGYDSPYAWLMPLFPTTTATTVCLKKTGPLRLIWHNFNNSQHLQIIFGRERPIQFSIDPLKSFKIGLESAAKFP